MARAEQAIIQGMRAEGIGRNMSEGELLAVLQHHSIHLHPAPHGVVDTIRFKNSHELAWSDAAHGAKRTKAEWTKRVAKVDQDPLDPRMRAQQGKFLVGGLNRTYSGRRYRGVPADQFPDVSNLGINFLKSQTSAPSNNWSASGWTVRVRAEWKRPLLDRLEAEGITPDSMYPPLG